MKNSLRVGRGQSIRLGNYIIKPAYGQYEDGIDRVWLQHDSGEGMDTPIDSLVEWLNEALEDYFKEFF